MRQLTCALVLTVSLVGAHGASAQVFPGTNVGLIPDDVSGSAQCGLPKDVWFAVTGATTTLATVAVELTLTHTWAGDLVGTPASSRQASTARPRPAAPVR